MAFMSSHCIFALVVFTYCEFLVHSFQENVTNKDVILKDDPQLSSTTVGASSFVINTTSLVAEISFLTVESSPSIIEESPSIVEPFPSIVESSPIAEATLIAETTSTVETTSIVEPFPSTTEATSTSSEAEAYNKTEQKECSERDRIGVYSDEYITFPNGSIFVEMFNTTYDPPFYIRSDIILVCPPKDDAELNNETQVEEKYDASFTYINIIGSAISMLCLVLHLIAFYAVPDMRNLPGYNLASLSISMLLSYVFQMVSYSKTIQESVIPCICVAIGSQFFMMSSFLWMSSMAFDVCRSLVRATRLIMSSTNLNMKTYCIYCLYSWGIPSLFVTVTLILDHVEGIPENFKPMIGMNDFCWFQQRTPLLVLYAGPVMTVIACNALLFGVSAYIIYANRMKMKGDGPHKSMLKKNFMLHGRLATIMGLSLITSIIANTFDAMWLWYIFVIMSTSQGLFIFVAFTCNQKVKKRVMARITSSQRKVSTSSTPTFQSYCNSGFSPDTDIELTSKTNAAKVDKAQ